MSLNQLIGVGLRGPHYKQMLKKTPSIGWVEVHSENFFTKGGVVANLILEIAERYPVSLHGIGLSLGSASGILPYHLKRLKDLIRRVQPKFVSEHLSWGYVDGVYIPDLLPVPYTKESFNIFKNNILLAQDFLQQEILIENPSSYIEYQLSDRGEAEFLVNLCKSTGAKILLDVNNIYVSACNHGWNAKEYVDSIPKDLDLVKEIHVAGHDVKILPNNQYLRVDTHNNYVSSEVWELYDYVIQRFGLVPTLLEWDSDIPSLEILICEADKAKSYLSSLSLPISFNNSILSNRRKENA